MDTHVRTWGENHRAFCLFCEYRENYNPYSGKNDIRYYGFESHRNSE